MPPTPPAWPAGSGLKVWWGLTVGAPTLMSVAGSWSRSIGQIQDRKEQLLSLADLELTLGVACLLVALSSVLAIRIALRITRWQHARDGTLR